MIVSGANLYLQPTDVSRAEQLFSKAAVVVCQLEVPPETSLAALIAGKKHGGVFMHECVGWMGGGGGGGSTHGSSLDFVRMCYDRQAMHEQQTRLHGKKYMCTYTCLNFIPASPTFIPTWLNITLNCLYFVLTCLCFIPTCLHFIPTCLHSNMAVCMHFFLNEQTIFAQ